MSVASTKAFYAQVAAGLAARRRAGRRRRPTGRAPSWPTTSTGCCERCGPCPTPWRGAGRAGGDRPHRRVGCPVPALLGGGRQRTGPGRGLRGAHQAVRAVLPVHLQRRHRGQEAHRPVVRAADPGVRGRAARPERRRRGQGGGDLPGPQGRAGRDRHRRRGGPVPRRRRGRGDRARRPTPTWPSCCRPWSATCSATRRPCPSTPRPARSARPGPPSRPPCGAGPDQTCSTGCGPTCCVASRALPRRRAARAATTATSRRRPRCAWSRCFATPPACCPLEGYELESGKIGAPSALIDDLLDALNSGIDELTRPVDAIKHQAKTVTVGISRSEDALFGVPLVKSHPGGRRRPRHPRLPGPAHPRRPGRRRWPRSSASPATGSTGLTGVPRIAVDRPGRHGSTSLPASRTDDRPPAARHQAPGRRGTGGHRGAGRQRRPHR